MLTHDFYVALGRALVEGSSTQSPVTIAVGAGDESWDRSAAPDADRDTRRLVREVARKPVPVEGVHFLDADGRSTSTPTARVEFKVRFTEDEAVASLRECGLFQGQGRSSVLLAYYVHPRIDKTEDMTLERAVRIDLTPQLPPDPEGGAHQSQFLGNTSTRELHDLERTTRNCQIDEIRFDHRYYFATPEEAREAGYDDCSYCIGRDL